MANIESARPAAEKLHSSSNLKSSFTPPVDYCVNSDVQPPHDSSLLSPPKFRVVETVRFINADMELATRQLAAESTMLPEEIWRKVSETMVKRHGPTYSGHTRNIIKQLVSRTRKEMMYCGNECRQIENSKFRMMSDDSNRAFLQYHGTLPHPNKAVDHVPSPFCQAMTFIIHDRQTNKCVPVVYILMSHTISEWKVDVATFTTDFKGALMNQCSIQFNKGQHICLLSGFKQAWRRYLTEELRFSMEEVEYGMQVGVLDLLTIIPQDEVESFEIPYVRSLLEKDLDEEGARKWDMFWQYFAKQWLPIKDTWNVTREKHIALDRIQYIAYEIICSSFLLNLVRENSESQSSIASGFAESDEDLRDERTICIKQKVEQKLKDLGAKEQLLMFVTGPAGAGKSTAIEVAQQFCFQFCKSMDILWGDKTFLFTAITGCAAALFGGVTLHSAAYLNSKSKNISPDMLHTWERI